MNEVREQNAPSRGRSSKRPLEGFFEGRNRLSATLLLLCVVLLAAWMGAADGGYFARDWGPPAFLLAVLALLVSIAGSFNGAKLRWGALSIGLFAVYTAWTFASILWSANKGDAWLGAGQTLLYLLVFWIAVALVAMGASRRWALAASALGPAIVAAFTLMDLGSRLEELFEDSRLVGTVGYYNGEAAFLLVSFWVAVYLGGSRRTNPVLRGAVLAGAVLCVALAVPTQSRGAMVAMALSLPIFFLLSGQRLRGLLALLPIATSLYVAFPGLNEVYLALLDGGDPAAALERALPTVWLVAALTGFYGVCWGLLDQLWKPPKSMALIAGGIALACCAVVLVAGTVVFNERVGNPVSVAEQKWEAFKANDTTGQEQSRYLSSSGSGRYTIWQATWGVFVSHPVIGVGAQNFEAEYYQQPEQSGSLRQPHSLPLEVLAERGIIGGTLFFGFLGVCLAVGLWKRFRGLHSEGKAQVGALVAAVAYWFVHSSADWFWQIPAVTLPVFVYLALLVSPWRTSRRRAETRETETTPIRWPLRVCGVAMAVLALAVFTPLYMADHYLARSYTAASQEEALAAVERAQEFNPLNSRLPRREAELATEAGDWERAEAAYHREIRLNPEHYAPYMFLATFHERRGEFDQAFLYYQKALALNPTNQDLENSVERLREEASPDG